MSSSKLKLSAARISNWDDTRDSCIKQSAFFLLFQLVLSPFISWLTWNEHRASTMLTAVACIQSNYFAISISICLSPHSLSLLTIVFIAIFIFQLHLTVLYIWWNKNSRSSFLLKFSRRKVDTAADDMGVE